MAAGLFIIFPEGNQLLCMNFTCGVQKKIRNFDCEVGIGGPSSDYLLLETSDIFVG
jgi:hypothetical protein